jgi:Dolichyl-phosphate-mannose-protein mannosyltransferase
MRRAVHVLEGLGPQEQRNSTWSFEQPYDHPYFGQLFLASALGIVGYPDLLNPRLGDIHSIEMLHWLPRLLIGCLAVVDTFLIYRIAERGYNNRRIAFIAAVLFAVMPMSWLARRVLLDSLLLPFLLLSILFAIEIKNRNIESSDNLTYESRSTIHHDDRISLLALLSGIFLGLAIFTKAPSVVMLPMVGFLIYNSAKSSGGTKKWKNLRLWFVPVIFTPLIWPAYAISSGEFEIWLNGLSWQAAERSNLPIWNSMSDIFKSDPVLFILGISAILYAVLIKKDIRITLWLVPFMVFFYFVDHLRDIHWIPVFPLFCIAGAILIVELSNKLPRNKLSRIAALATISAIGTFGFVVTNALVTLNLNSTYFEIYSFIAAYVPSQDKDLAGGKENATIMGSNWMQIFSWVPKYIFDKDHAFKTFQMRKNLPVENDEKAILLVDYKDLERLILSESNQKNVKQKEFYKETHHLTKFEGKAMDQKSGYPYATVSEHPAIDIGIEVRSNY